MGSLLTLPSFTRQFPEIDTSKSAAGDSHESTLQGVVIGIYEIGCLLVSSSTQRSQHLSSHLMRVSFAVQGALSCMWLGDMLGRRKVIMIGAVWMVVGAILQCTSSGKNAIVQLAIARVVTGIGNGMNTATIPTWQSECSPAHLRGKLIMVRA